MRTITLTQLAIDTLKEQICGIDIDDRTYHLYASDGGVDIEGKARVRWSNRTADIADFEIVAYDDDDICAISAAQIDDLNRWLCVCVSAKEEEVWRYGEAI